MVHLNRMMYGRRCSVLVLLVVVVALLSISSSMAKPQAKQPRDDSSDHPGPVLIVEYSTSALTAAATEMASMQPSISIAANTAAHVAAAAAGERGASQQRQEAVATIAAEAAAIAPAVAALTSSVVQEAEQSGVSVTGLTHYHTVLKGAALRMGSHKDAAQLRKVLATNSSVKRIHEASARALIRPIKRRSSARIQQQQPHRSRRSSNNRPTSRAVDTDSHDSSSSSSFSPLPKTPLYTVTGADKMRNGGLDGSGVLVCVVDTGISFKQSVFGDCSAINHPERKCKVVTGYNFVGDGYRGIRQGPSPVAGELPTDCMGHGTMVSSVVGTKSGIAPGVTLGAYRVFGCDGFVGDNILIEAIDRAVRDGCDVINLSLASGSGYAESSIYSKVMQSAMSKGVIMVKAAGNSGADGPFRADVATAVGAIAVASVDAHSRKVEMSQFSSYGPNPNLDLLPHVSAPGGDIPVRTMDGSKDFASGTSFAAPYTAGIVAMWLQHKQQLASKEGVPLDTDETSNDAALRGLVATAQGVQDESDSEYLEPVARMGAGLIQGDSFIKNQLQVSTIMLQPPSGLKGPYTTSFTVNWKGPPAASGKVTYIVAHQPSSAISLSNGWYGTEASIQKVYEAAELSFSPSEVEIDTARPEERTVKVTFNLPSGLQGKRLLYSGLIKLIPTVKPAVPSVTVPYQGFAAPLKDLRLSAKAITGDEFATAIQTHGNALCYSPHMIPSFFFEVMDHLATVPEVCTGGLASQPDQVINVDLDVLTATPECSLRVTLAPEVPLQQLLIQIADEAGERLGYLEPLVPNSGGALAKVHQVMSYCTRFDGTYMQAEGGQSKAVEVGSKYRLQAFMHGPVSLADMALKVSPRVEKVAIKGVMKITSSKRSPSRIQSRGRYRHRVTTADFWGASV